MSLKNQLERPTSPLRVFLAQNANSITFDRSRWTLAHKDRSPILAPDDPSGGRTPSQVLGHAIGARVEWQFAPIGHGAIRSGARQLQTAGSSDAVISELLTYLQGPPPDDSVLAARIAWYAGLCEQTFRCGRFDAPWYRPMFELEDLDAVLRCAPDVWINDVVGVASEADRILPASSQASYCGPAFAGSAYVGGADADLICDSLLIDIKTVKDDRLVTRDLHQILCYALLDWDDQYGLTAVALASLRWQALVAWDLEEVCGGRAGITRLRGLLRESLTEGPGA